jgi:hypothetical protein
MPEPELGVPRGATCSSPAREAQVVEGDTGRPGEHGGVEPKPYRCSDGGAWLARGTAATPARRIPNVNLPTTPCYAAAR